MGKKIMWGIWHGPGNLLGKKRQKKENDQPTEHWIPKYSENQSEQKMMWQTSLFYWNVIVVTQNGISSLYGPQVLSDMPDNVRACS